MMEKYPGWSPLNYVMHNPVKLVDPDGQEPDKGGHVDEDSMHQFDTQQRPEAKTRADFLHARETTNTNFSTEGDFYKESQLSFLHAGVEFSHEGGLPVGSLEADLIEGKAGLGVKNTGFFAEAMVSLLSVDISTKEFDMGIGKVSFDMTIYLGGLGAGLEAGPKGGSIDFATGIGFGLGYNLNLNPERIGPGPKIPFNRNMRF